MRGGTASKHLVNCAAPSACHVRACVYARVRAHTSVHSCRRSSSSCVHCMGVRYTCYSRSITGATSHWRCKVE
jgi:hypothetical protein